MTTLVHHQHYFPVVSEQGTLKEAFLAIVNTQPQDERVIAKNAERVVAARLRDAKFFWDADRKAPLESRMDRLHTVLFHKKLRAAATATRPNVSNASPGGLPRMHSNVRTPPLMPRQAARLAKADLTTDMVFEFPELQGTMGGIYAREEGLPEPVSKAIYFHYLPVGVEPDAPPSKEQLGPAAVSLGGSLARRQARHRHRTLRRRRASDGFSGSVRPAPQCPRRDPDTDGSAGAYGSRQGDSLDTLLAEAVKRTATLPISVRREWRKGLWLERVSTRSSSGVSATRLFAQPRRLRKSRRSAPGASPTSCKPCAYPPTSRPWPFSSSV